MKNIFYPQLFFLSIQMYRHGDRNPIKQTLGDPYDETYWPRGFAQLTTVNYFTNYNRNACI